MNTCASPSPVGGAGAARPQTVAGNGSSRRPHPSAPPVARRLLGRVAWRAGIKIRLSDGVCFGPKSGPTMELLRPEAFFSRLGREERSASARPIWPGIGTLVPGRCPRNNGPPGRHAGSRRAPNGFVGSTNPGSPGMRTTTVTGPAATLPGTTTSPTIFSRSFFDESMTYSSALFVGGAEESLAEAQVRKMDRLLDITGVGCGSRCWKSARAGATLAFARGGPRGAGDDADAVRGTSGAGPRADRAVRHVLRR